MDIASIVGLIGCFGMIFLGIVTGETGFAALGSFIHVISIIITFGGTFMSLLASYSLHDFVNGLKCIGLVFKQPKNNEAETIKKIIDLSNIARKEGLLILEEAVADLDDEFMKKGILLIVDGTDPDLLRAIMETELMCVENRHKNVMQFWMDMASMGPAWGMIGTLVGLVNMLKNLEDASAIGPNMSTALLTTLYGSMIANWIATPVANKLRANNTVEVMLKEVTIEGLLSIQAGENPRVIEEKLKSFLSPKQRGEFTENAENGGE